MQQLSEAFTELTRSFQGSVGIGTSSAGVCIWPVGPLLAHAAARHGLPAALRDPSEPTDGVDVLSGSGRAMRPG